MQDGDEYTKGAHFGHQVLVTSPSRRVRATPSQACGVPRQPPCGPPRKGGARRTAEQVAATLALPASHTASTPLPPLPMTGLHRLPRDNSLLYGIGRVDASGRVANRHIVQALGRRHGDKLEAAVASRAIVLRASPEGLFSVPKRPCIVIPVTARRLCDIQAGDDVLLVGAPDFSVVIVHTLSVLDDMVAEYHLAHSVSKAL
jgi:hypothetical protein